MTCVANYFNSLAVVWCRCRSCRLLSLLLRWNYTNFIIYFDVDNWAVLLSIIGKVDSFLLPCSLGRMCVKYSKEGSNFLNNSDVDVQAISKCWKEHVTSSLPFSTLLHHVVLNIFIADWALHEGSVLYVGNELSTNFSQDFFWSVEDISLFEDIWWQTPPIGSLSL